MMENKRQLLKVKQWVIEKAQETASKYNTFIDYKRDESTEIHTALVEDGYITVYVDEVLKETEKAVEVKLATGEVIGSYKGWNVWIPKSQMMVVA